MEPAAAQALYISGILLTYGVVGVLGLSAAVNRGVLPSVCCAGLLLFIGGLAGLVFWLSPFQQTVSAQDISNTSTCQTKLVDYVVINSGPKDITVNHDGSITVPEGHAGVIIVDKKFVTFKE